MLASSMEHGRAEGRQQGRLEGQAAILERQLTKKFGSVPVWAQDRLRNVTVGELETWADRILIAENVETVFGQ